MLKSYAERIAPFAPTALRIGVGLVFVFMGLPKIQNPGTFMTFLERGGFPAPSVIGWLPVILEPIGGALLILGIGTRWLALYFTLEMFVTAFLWKMARGTPFIQAGGQPGVGYELDVLLLVGAFALFVLGSGQLSMERNVLRREL